MQIFDKIDECLVICQNFSTSYIFLLFTANVTEPQFHQYFSCQIFLKSNSSELCVMWLRCQIFSVCLCRTEPNNKFCLYH